MLPVARPGIPLGIKPINWLSGLNNQIFHNITLCLLALVLGIPRKDRGNTRPRLRFVGSYKIPDRSMISSAAWGKRPNSQKRSRTVYRGR